jgi:hypothetical protein
VSVGIKDTTAWRVIEQILKHVWGPGEEMNDDEAYAVCKMFWRSGGSWKQLVEGDPEHVSILEECINNVISARKLKKIALKIAKTLGNV